MSRLSEIVSRLPSGYKNVTCTLKSASEDVSKHVCMVESVYDVLDYDKIAEIHQKKGHYSFRLSSNDAVYAADDGTIYFIEFKNGSFKEVEIAKKGIGSAMLAMDLGMVDSLKDLRRKAVYILVYKQSVIEDKQTASQKKLSGNLRKKSGRRITKLAILKEVDWIYHESFSYTVEEFESEFVKKIIEKR